MADKVIDSSYCDPHRITNLRINTERGVAYGENKDRLFYIENTSLSVRNRRVLYDGTQRPIVSFYNMIMRPQGRCKVFRGERNDLSELLFSVKKVNSSNTPSDKTILNVFLAQNQDEERKNCRIIIHKHKDSCTVYAGESSDNELATMKNSNGNFDVSVNPDVDKAFIVALLMIVKDTECFTLSSHKRLTRLTLSSLASARSLFPRR